jgi:nuclear transport factor 2 (NTF2) superfamily protein
MEPRHPVPPFTQETAQGRTGSQDAWNTCDPEKVAVGPYRDSARRHGDAFFEGREEIVASAAAGGLPGSTAEVRP